MKIYTAQLTDDVITAPTLNSAYIGHPEVLERVTKQICTEYNFYFTGMALGYGRYATTEEITKNSDKMTIGNDYITWAVMPRTRQLVTLAANISAGVGGSGAAITITLSPNDDWVKKGMTLKYTYAATGTSILFYVITNPVANSSNWDITAKIESSSSTTVPTQIDSGSQLGQTTTATASCTSTTTYKPEKLYDIYRNYNTTMKPKHTICKDGLTTATWFVSEVSGEKCWTPQEEYQFEMETLKDLEFGIVYNVSTVNSSGTVYITDADGNSVMKGDGLLAQLFSANTVTWDVSTYYNQPAAYATFFNQLKETIENWSIAYGVTNDVTLFVHTGTKGYGFLQEVLKDNVDQSGGAGMVFVKNYKGRSEAGDDQMTLSRNISKYFFASFTLVLLKCSVFDDPGVQGTPQSGVSSLAPPMESFRMLIAPDTDCEGYPLIQLFFRGGCGLDDVWSSSYTPGTIDPTNGYKTTKGKISVTDYSGYDIKKEVEYNLVVRDPSKFLNFVPYQS